MPDFRSLSLKQLRALAETVRNGSVTGAAKVLHVTPPAITTQLKTLEAAVGDPLFDRSGGKFDVTAVGGEILELATDIERMLDRTQDRVAALRSGAIGSVILAVVSTGKYFAPGIVAAFRDGHPNIRVTLSIGNRGEVVRGLEHNEYDLLIMGRAPKDIAVESEFLSTHPHILIASPSHPFASHGIVEPKDLLKERFLTREVGSGTRILTERFLDRIGEGQRYDAVEMGTNETIKQAVIAGLGVAIISAHTCHSELSTGRLVALPVDGLPLIREWRLLHRSDHALSAAACVLREFILEHATELFPSQGIAIH